MRKAKRVEREKSVYQYISISDIRNVDSGVNARSYFLMWFVNWGFSFRMGSLYRKEFRVCYDPPLLSLGGEGGGKGGAESTLCGLNEIGIGLQNNVPPFSLFLYSFYRSFPLYCHTLLPVFFVPPSAFLLSTLYSLKFTPI